MAEPSRSRGYRPQDRRNCEARQGIDFSLCLASYCSPPNIVFIGEKRNFARPGIIT